MVIGSKNIRRGSPAFIIGEVAQAHDGSLGTAHAYIDAIADAGADAVKFQTHIAEAESTPEEPWRIKFSKQDATRYDYWRRMEFTLEQWKGLKKHCEDRNIVFMSSPFSFEAVDLLMKVGTKVWKIASGEVNNLPMIRRLVDTKLPILFSSGLSYMEEISAAINLCKQGDVPFGLFQCTTAYPCPPEKVGLNVLEAYREQFDCPIGLSDHSGEIFPGLAAVSQGCELLEVHVTFHKKMFGPDVPASLDLEQFGELIRGTRFIETMLGNPINKKDQVDGASDLRNLFTKSLVAKCDLAAGAHLQAEQIALKKPCTGIPGNQMDEYVGRKLCREVASNTVLTIEDFD